MSESAASPDFVELTATIISAYVSNNTVPTADLPSLLNTIHTALAQTASGPVEAKAVLTPAVPIKKSITPDYVICLEDGKKFKSLKRHLRATYGLTPEQYRQKWGLPSDYPVVAPNYAKTRAELARNLGLGQIRKNGKVASRASALDNDAVPADPKRSAATAAIPSATVVVLPTVKRKKA